MSVNPIPKKVFALIRHAQEKTHISSFDGFQLPRIGKHIHIYVYMYTYSPASYMGVRVSTGIELFFFLMAVQCCVFALV